MYTDYWYDIMAQEVSSRQIAESLSGDHKGPERTVSTFAPIDEAKPNQLTFCKPGYDKYIEKTKSNTIITHSDLDTNSEKTLIVVEDPKAAFVEIIHEFFIGSYPTQIHETADISIDATIGENCLIGPFVVIGPDVRIGDNCIIGTGTTIGQSGFGYQHTQNSQLIHIPHKGDIIIEDNVHIGANCAIDRATFDTTRISKGSKIHHMVHVAHNSRVGVRNRINSFCILAGSVTTGNAVRIHPHVVVGSHTDISDRATIGANSTVLDDVETGQTVVGSPAQPIE